MYGDWGVSTFMKYRAVCVGRLGREYVIIRVLGLKLVSAELAECL